MLLDWFIRQRSNAMLVVMGVGAIIVLVLGAIIGGSAGSLVLALGVIGLMAAGVMGLVRRAVLRRACRVLGGREYHVVSPIVATRLPTLRKEASAFPVSKSSLWRLLWLARTPSKLQEQVATTADVVRRAVPDLIVEVRDALEGYRESRPNR